MIDFLMLCNELLSESFKKIGAKEIDLLAIE
jgi:hypothetical protein